MTSFQLLLPELWIFSVFTEGHVDCRKCCKCHLFCVTVQAWSQFASRLEDLAQPEKLESALSCLNLLVTDALRHVPDVIAYLSRLRNQSVFNFCAIPQVKTIWSSTQIMW